MNKKIYETPVMEVIDLKLERCVLIAESSGTEFDPTRPEDGD